MVSSRRVIFDRDNHSYRLNTGEVLSGITPVICRFLGLDYSGAPDIYRQRGSLIHRQLENWVKGESSYISDAVRLALPEIKKGVLSESEKLVSDFKLYATAIDLVVWYKEGNCRIYDLKTGKFNLEYLRLQLSICGYLLGSEMVIGGGCLHLPTKRVIPIPLYGDKEVKEVLYGRNF